MADHSGRQLFEHIQCVPRWIESMKTRPMEVIYCTLQCSKEPKLLPSAYNLFRWVVSWLHSVDPSPDKLYTLPGDPFQRTLRKHILASGDPELLAALESRPIMEDLTPELHLAIWNRQYNLVTTYLRDPVLVIAKDHLGNTALHLLANCLAFDLTKGEGAQILGFLRLMIDEKNNIGQTALHVAAANGCTRHLSALLQAGANINARDVLDQTALFLAARGAHLDSCRALLAAGADKKTVTLSGHSPLDVATDRVNIAKAAQQDSVALAATYVVGLLGGDGAGKAANGSSPARSVFAQPPTLLVDKQPTPTSGMNRVCSS
eukprot:TRINITY_DN4440_c0_g1_i2.p1 TRINITY_DN4440_c0_g1~~TRINITY_DN4440_c0_g1_i2.p1  ORF type:complete len:328 (-),score=41.38 TRINITY_DN4440_c0_g1_i2:54-1010(-)